MFIHSQSSYQVEESSMEEFLLAIQQQKQRTPQNTSRYNLLEQKLLDAQAPKNNPHNDKP